MLGDILKTGDRQSATSASMALANLGGPEAREQLIEAALADRAQITGALNQQQQMSGDDVDQALLSVVRQGASADRRAALPRLIKSGNPEALQLAVDFASKGSRNERYEALRMLGAAGTPKSFQALLTNAGGTRGQSRVQALALLAQAHPTAPAVGQLLSASLFSGRREEAQYAAGVLGRIGTEDARTALVSALPGNDANLAAAAAGALGQLGMTDQVKTALMSAAQSNPQVKTQELQQLVQAGSPEGQ